MISLSPFLDAIAWGFRSQALGATRLRTQRVQTLWLDIVNQAGPTDSPGRADCPGIRLRARGPSGCTWTELCPGSSVSRTFLTQDRF